MNQQLQNTEIMCQDKDKMILQLKDELHWSEMKGAGGDIHVHEGKCIHIENADTDRQCIL